MKTTQFALFFSNYLKPEPPVSHRNVRGKFCKALKEPMVNKTGRKLGANKMLPLQENPKVLQLMVMMVTVMVMM